MDKDKAHSEPDGALAPNSEDLACYENPNLYSPMRRAAATSKCVLT
jgi:hypothetical protein